MNNKFIAKLNYINSDIIYFDKGDVITIDFNPIYNISNKNIYKGYNVTKGTDFTFEIDLLSFISNYLLPYSDKENVKSNFENVIDEMISTYKKKNTDYGNSFDQSLDKFGLIASVVRLNDKFNRIESLIKNKEQLVKDESIRDTFLDMANYAAMTVAWLDNK